MKNPEINFRRKDVPFRGLLLMLLIASLIITQTACSGETGSGMGGSGEPVTGENYYLDTVCTIAIYEITDDSGKTVAASDAEDAAQAAIDAAWEKCAELDKTLSRTQEASEISKLNNAGGEWTEVSDETAELVREGLHYSELSGGDFDITIGGVTDLWDFHADPEDARVPDADVLAEAVKHVDYRNVESDGNKLRITDPEARIDLGGIAKGYIGDRMTEVLEEAGVTSGIINLGGNVICIGAKDNGAEGGAGAFVIGVEAPYSDRSEIVGKINAKDMTLVTSGVYERQIEVDGKTYHHILSTDTGYSVETDLDAVTLTGAKGHSADLDALSTICLIKGHDQARELIENTEGVEAVFILHDGSLDQTSGMKFEPEK
jgi:thiamine biosynthesis lipoprotein